jgi:hypothetical protein
MSINTKKELLLRIRREYLAAGRQRKSKLLDSLIESTGYNRKYAISLLSQAASKKATNQLRSRKPKYESDVVDVVRQLWRAANGICAKRLKPFLPTLIDALERCGHMKLSKQLKEKVLRISLSTLERILKKERDKEPKGRSLTRPGSLLKKQVAVKIFAPWNDQKVGFFEVDLVAHCGDDISGRFLQTLTMTDIASGWTEIVPLLRKSEAQVRAAMEQVIPLLPFKLQGIDCDNGGEFLNHEMVAWCKARKITFTRSRAYRKNDQAHVEEKNGSVVRRLIGYERFEGRESWEVMTDLYSVSRLYINFFQPSMKLIKKTRIGAKIIKQYDPAKTPLERLLGSSVISKKQKSALLSEFRELDPLALLAEMARLQAKLWQTTKSKTNPPAAESSAIVTEPMQQNEKEHWYIDRPATATAGKAPQLCSIPKRAARQRNKPKSPQNRRKVDTRIHITENFVGNAVHPPSGQIIYRDSKLIGFGLRVTPRSKSFIVEARVNGMNRRITIGRADLFSAEESRNEATQLLRQMTRGITPSTPKNKRKKRVSRTTTNKTNQSAPDTRSITIKPAQQDEKEHSCNRNERQRNKRTHAESRQKNLRNPQLHITEDFVDNAVHPLSGQIIHRDSQLKGFGLRVTPRSKSFIVEARVNGTNRRITIGRADLFSAEEARHEAAKLLRQMTRGIEPLTLRKKHKSQ